MGRFGVMFQAYSNYAGKIKKIQFEIPSNRKYCFRAPARPELTI
jgi:hypothetical protein